MREANCFDEGDGVEASNHPLSYRMTAEFSSTLFVKKYILSARFPVSSVCFLFFFPTFKNYLDNLVFVSCKKECLTSERWQIY